MKHLFRFVIVLSIITAIVLFASPYYHLYTLKNAYEKGDYAYIIDSVDFETLRPNLKSQLYVRLDDILTQSKLATAVSMIGVERDDLTGYGERFIDKTIDATITPTNLNKLATGDLTDSEPLLITLAVAGGLVDTGKLVGDFLKTGNIDKAVARQQEHIASQFASTETNPDQTDNKPTLRYCGINCFAVDTTVKNYPISVVMTRHQGVFWRIDNVVFTQ